MGGGKVVKEGYLIKSPPLGGKGVKNWHKRFFCLRTTKMLEYYKNESDSGEKPKGFINLEDCVAINAALIHKKHKHVFSIELKDRTYYLVASCRAEMQDWVDTLCASAFKDRGTEVGGSSSKMSFKQRFRSSSESSSTENMLLASSVQKSIKQQLQQDSVQVQAGTKLSDAFSMKGLHGGAMTLPRSMSTSSNESEGISRHNSLSSTPSSSAGIPIGQARSLPLPTSDPPAANPIYNTPVGTGSLRSNTAPSTSPKHSSNPLHQPPLSANPLYNTPRNIASPSNTYNTPSSLPANTNPLYNTPTQHLGVSLGRGPPRSPAPGQTPPPLVYNTPTSRPSGSDPKVNRTPSRGSSMKSHRSALLSGNMGTSREDTSPHDSPQPAPRQRKVSSNPNHPEPSSSQGSSGEFPPIDRMILTESPPVEDPPALPPPVIRTNKPDIPLPVDTSPEPPPVNRDTKPPLEPPSIDRSTKPSPTLTTSQSPGSLPVTAEDSSDEEWEGDNGEEEGEFNEVPQLTEKSLHYVRLLHLSSTVDDSASTEGPPPTQGKVKPVPLPRTSSLPTPPTEYTLLNTEKTEELQKVLANRSISEPLQEVEYEEDDECVHDVIPEDQARYINLTKEGGLNEETDPQYYLIMKQQMKEASKTDLYVTLVPDNPQQVMSEEDVEDPYTVVTR